MTEPLKRSYVKRDTAQARGYSQAVVTEGRCVVWLAGQVAIEDSAGRSLAADFDGQVREVFARLGHTLEEAGAAICEKSFARDPLAPYISVATMENCRWR